MSDLPFNSLADLRSAVDQTITNKTNTDKVTAAEHGPLLRRLGTNVFDNAAGLAAMRQPLGYARDPAEFGAVYGPVDDAQRSQNVVAFYTALKASLEAVGLDQSAAVIITGLLEVNDELSNAYYAQPETQSGTKGSVPLMLCGQHRDTSIIHQFGTNKASFADSAIGGVLHDTNPLRKPPFDPLFGPSVGIIEGLYLRDLMLISETGHAVALTQKSARYRHAHVDSITVISHSTGHAGFYAIDQYHGCWQNVNAFNCLGNGIELTKCYGCTGVFFSNFNGGIGFRTNSTFGDCYFVQAQHNRQGNVLLQKFVSSQLFGYSEKSFRLEAEPRAVVELTGPTTLSDANFRYRTRFTAAGDLTLPASLPAGQWLMVQQIPNTSPVTVQPLGIPLTTKPHAISYDNVHNVWRMRDISQTQADGRMPNVTVMGTLHNSTIQGVNWERTLRVDDTDRDEPATPYVSVSQQTTPARSGQRCTMDDWVPLWRGTSSSNAFGNLRWDTASVPWQLYEDEPFPAPVPPAADEVAVYLFDPANNSKSYPWWRIEVPENFYTGQDTVRFWPLAKETPNVQPYKQGDRGRVTLEAIFDDEFLQWYQDHIPVTPTRWSQKVSTGAAALLVSHKKAGGVPVVQFRVDNGNRNDTYAIDPLAKRALFEVDFEVTLSPSTTDFYLSLQLPQHGNEVLHPRMGFNIVQFDYELFRDGYEL